MVQRGIKWGHPKTGEEKLDCYSKQRHCNYCIGQRLSDTHTSTSYYVGIESTGDFIYQAKDFFQRKTVRAAITTTRDNVGAVD